MRTQKNIKDIDWKPTMGILKAYEDFSKQCFLAGMDAYLSGDCTSKIIGEAIFYQYQSADEVLDKLCSVLDGQVVTEDELTRLVRIHFFLWGVYRAFAIKATRTMEPVRGGKVDA